MRARERIHRAMALGRPDDRVPVMCQLAIGHYFLHAGIDPFDIWFTSEGFARALIELCRRYRFDGILVNLPGRDPAIRDHVRRVERGSDEDLIHWDNGGMTRLPHDDCPHYVPPAGAKPRPVLDDIDPDRLYYIEPWHATGVAYPFVWDFETSPRRDRDFFPSYVGNTLARIIELAGGEFSIHGEVFSPFAQLLELLGCENGLLALVDDPGKVHACLDRLTEGVIDLAARKVRLGADAILISSAFAGGGFISRGQYEEFVLPYERRLAASIKAEAARPGKGSPGGRAFVYTHTCGAIGDRLDLMVETGTDGIDTLDPPPLGTVELDKAKEFLAGKCFIKGNIDSVNTLLHGPTEAFIQDVRRRLEVGKAGGGYILSSACSVAPRVDPDRLSALADLAELHGRY